MKYNLLRYNLIVWDVGPQNLIKNITLENLTVNLKRSSVYLW